MRILLAAIFLFSDALIANEVSFTAEDVVSTEQIDYLAKHPTWLRLLHIYPGLRSTFSTDIKSTDFYLSAEQPPKPKSELIATLNIFYPKTRRRKARIHTPLCRFPARLLWLEQQLPSQFKNLPKPKCQALDNWYEKNKKQKVHVVHVSGYFSNPASAFGHLLLRVK